MRLTVHSFLFERKKNHPSPFFIAYQAALPDNRGEVLSFSRSFINFITARTVLCKALLGFYTRPVDFCKGKINFLRSICKNPLKVCTNPLSICMNLLTYCKSILIICKSPLTICQNLLIICKNPLSDCKSLLTVCKSLQWHIKKHQFCLKFNVL